MLYYFKILLLLSVLLVAEQEMGSCFTTDENSWPIDPTVSIHSSSSSSSDISLALTPVRPASRFSHLSPKSPPTEENLQVELPRKSYPVIFWDLVPSCSSCSWWSCLLWTAVACCKPSEDESGSTTTGTSGSLSLQCGLRPPVNWFETILGRTGCLDLREGTLKTLWVHLMLALVVLLVVGAVVVPLFSTSMHSWCVPSTTRLTRSFFRDPSFGTSYCELRILRSFFIAKKLNIYYYNTDSIFSINLQNNSSEN